MKKYKLITLFALSRIADIYTTYLCLDIVGIEGEGNILTRALIGNLGFTGMIVFNLMIVLAISLAYLYDITKINWALIIKVLTIAFFLIAIFNSVMYFLIKTI